jgi:hypothetical protein
MYVMGGAGAGSSLFFFAPSFACYWRNHIRGAEYDVSNILRGFQYETHSKLPKLSFDHGEPKNAAELDFKASIYA